MGEPVRRRSARCDRQNLPDATTPRPENRLGRCRRWRPPAPPSDLRLGQVNDETVKFGCDDQLAAQTAVRPALARGEFEHRLFVVRLPRGLAELVFLDIDVTGGAH